MVNTAICFSLEFKHICKQNLITGLERWLYKALGLVISGGTHLSLKHQFLECRYLKFLTENENLSWPGEGPLINCITLLWDYWIYVSISNESILIVPIATLTMQVHRPGFYSRRVYPKARTKRFWYNVRRLSRLN